MTSDQPRKARVTKERDVRIHAELWHAANCLLESGQRRMPGSAHEFAASLVFRAFFVEAFLNYLGDHLVPHWKYLERLRPEEKLGLLLDVIEMKPDYGSRPWQAVRDLFRFRNALAHGRPQQLRSETQEDIDESLDGKLGDYLKTRWEEFCSEDNAVSAKTDVEEIANLLYERVNAKKKLKGPYGPFAFGFQIHGAEL